MKPLIPPKQTPIFHACKFFEEGVCAHKDAPEPHVSECIGRPSCAVWDEPESAKVNAG